MTEHLSDQDLERIAEFADTPAYEREPEQLLPEGERPDEADQGETEGAEYNGADEPEQSTRG